MALLEPRLRMKDNEPRSANALWAHGFWTPAGAFLVCRIGGREFEYGVRPRPSSAQSEAALDLIFDKQFQLKWHRVNFNKVRLVELRMHLAKKHVLHIEGVFARQDVGVKV